MKIKRGSTSVRRLIFIADSSSTTGAGLANLAHNSAGLVAYYFAGDLSNEVQITLATATLGTYTSGGFVAVDNTNMPGWYEIGIPDAALDGGNECAIQLRGATNMVPVNIYIELDAFDYQTATQPVNVTQISGDATAADNAESFFDGTGYAGTNNVIPTVSTVTNGVTVATNSDKTGYSLTQSFPTHFADMQIAANGHVSSVVESMANNSVTASAIQGDAITAAKIAADAITEIQSGLATSANQTTILDRQAYTLAVLAGACSDPQTASETYVLTIGGSTYTVDMAGQTSTGTRTAPTLTKT